MMKMSFLVVCFAAFCECSELEISDHDYEFIDGISVPKEAQLAEQRQEKDEKDSKDTGNHDDDEDNDDDEGEVNYQLDDITEDDEPEDEEELTRHLPTKCHVCRLLVVELEDKLSKLGRIRKERGNRAPMYYKEKKVILNAIQNLCNRMKSYNIRRSQAFRYKKGVKSYGRRQLEEAMKDSRIQKFVFFTPEDEIDDRTGEIRRQQNQCHDLVVDHQHNLIHWFTKIQSRDLTTWFCRNRVLVNENKDCLAQEIPAQKKKKKIRENKNKRNKNQFSGKSESKTEKHEEL